MLLAGGSMTFFPFQSIHALSSALQGNLVQDILAQLDRLDPAEQDEIIRIEWRISLEKKNAG